MPHASDLLSLHAGLRPAKKALHDLSLGRIWRYDQFDRSVDQCCAVLAAQGVKLQDRIVVISKNCAAMVILHLACARMGLMFVPMNWRLSGREIKDLIEDCQPVLIYGDECLETLGVSGTSFEMLLAQIDQAVPHLHINPTDPDHTSLILYTSGTTGRPKGVMLSEDNLCATGRNFSVLGQVSHDSVFLVDAPMFHIIGLISNLRPVLLNGATLIISDGFKPDITLARMAKHHVSHYFCVPQMAQALRRNENFDANQLSSLTAIFTGGAPHPAAQIKAWTKLGIACVDGFGMSEVGTVSGMPVDIEQIEKYAGAVGLTTPEVQTRIVNEDGVICGPNEIGELQIKGSNVFQRYWKQESATTKSFSHDGWFKSGDLFICEPNGYLRLVGRSKNMYISGGENVYPAEIEAVLASHPDLIECAVIGQEDEKWGEVGHLFIVLVPKGISKSDQIRDSLRTELLGKIAKYKVPKHVTILKTLPRIGSGKVNKKALTALLVDTGA